MKLTFVTTGLDFGGAEIQVVNLAKAFQDRGWKVEVISLQRPVAFESELGERGIRVRCLELTGYAGLPRAIYRLVRALRQSRPDVVHSHMIHANFLTRAVRPLAPVPCLVCTAHCIDEEKGRPGELLYRYTDRLADLTTNVSQAAVDRYVEVGAAPAERIRFVPNGIDADGFLPRPEQRDRLRRKLGVDKPFVWLAVGRLFPQKDYPNLLRAFAKLVEQKSEQLLLVVGRGELEASLKALAHDLQLGDSVRFLGLRTDVAMLMNAADGFVMSSSFEGLPMVLLEASASGLPVVATDVGGNREIVRDEETGFLVPPHDPEALAEAMARLASLGPEAAEQFRRSARQRSVEAFGLNRIVSRWIDLYAELGARA